MGLIPNFNERSLIRDLANFAKDNEAKFVEALQFIGETFVNEARNKQTYQDRTGNLRTSIGYGIVKNNRILKKKVQGREDVLNEAVSELQQSGIYLIVFAGMEYALYVEVKGYDVLSGSRPSRSEIIQEFKDLLL